MAQKSFKNSHDAYDNYLDLYMNYNYEQELRTTLFIAVDDMEKFDLSYIISEKGSSHLMMILPTRRQEVI